MPKPAVRIVNVRTPRQLRMFPLTDAARPRQALSNCTPRVLRILLMRREAQIRTPIIQTIAIAMVNDNASTRPGLRYFITKRCMYSVRPSMYALA